MIILYIFTLILVILLGSFVFISNHKNKINRTFALLVFLISMWILTLIVADNVKDIYTVELFSKLALIFGFLIITCFWYFSLIFPIPKLERRSLNIVMAFLIVFIFISDFLVLSTDLAVRTVTIEDWGANVVPGPYYYIFLVYLTLFTLLGIIYLFVGFNNLDKSKKHQVIYLISGSVLSIIFVVFTNVILPILNYSELGPLGPPSIIFFIAFTSYAITRHRLMDIRFLVVRSVMYLLLLAIFGLIYMFSIFVIGGLVFGSFTGKEAYWASMVVALLVGFTFYPLKNYFTKATDKIFFKDRYDFEELTSKLNETATSTIVLPELLFKFLNLLIDEMRITKGAFVLLEGKKVFEIQSVGYKESFVLEPKEIKHLVEEKKLEVFEEAKEGSRCKDILRKRDAAVIVPLITEEELIGLLFLGNKKSGDAFSDKDIKVVEIVSKQLSLGIQNAKAYEKTQKFNITLKAEVNRATRELRAANEKLQELDKAKDEFISLASHEIRTPIATLEGYVSILNNPKLPQGDRKVMIERAYEGVERLSTLAKDLLDVSRIEQKRMKLNKEMVRLESIITRSLDGFELQANDKKIYLKYKKPERALPQVYIDQDRIGEVFNNLIGNAIKFTHKGGITVTTEKKGDEILVSVSDTGAGIPKESIDHIFEKFYQAETASSVLNNEKGGTGLGLYITRHIVEIHGGKIWLESKIHKGTTFYFTIPINKK